MEEKLFTEFPEISTQSWEEVITKDLKGADYERKLVWRTIEGFNVRPYYRAENLKELKHLSYLPAQFPFVRGTKTNNDWKIRQNFEVDNVKETNQQVLDVLMKGVDSIGLSIKNTDSLLQPDFDTLLNEVHLPSVEINFASSCTNNLAITKMFVAKASKYKADELSGSIEFSPIGNLTSKGSFCADEKAAFALLKAVVEEAREFPKFKTVAVDASVFHNSGATIVQELAFALAMGNEYLVQLSDLGLSADEIAKNIKFTFAISSNYFMEIAKIRAARMLWANIVKTYDDTTSCAQKMHIHAVTSSWLQTVYDPYVNVLRATTESMSATIAGVDSLEVKPFDDPFEKPTTISNRIARNIQVILKDESYFNKVVDPAAGSYYVEVLTKLIAEQSWELFKMIEDKGGYIAAFKEGIIQTQVKESAAKHDKNIATRREIILGSNQYPNFNEQLEPEIIKEVKKREHQSQEKMQASGLIAEPLREYRGAQAFEDLRMTTENSGIEVNAFMLTFGHLAMCRARAQFASNFFACAGFKTIDNNRFETIEEGVKAALESKSQIVVACSSDDEYLDAVPRIAELLGDKAIVVVAGAPSCAEELQAKGINHFISVRSNVLDTLKQYQKELGIHEETKL